MENGKQKNSADKGVQRGKRKDREDPPACDPFFHRFGNRWNSWIHMTQVDGEEYELLDDPVWENNDRYNGGEEEKYPSQVGISEQKEKGNKKRKEQNSLKKIGFYAADGKINDQDKDGDEQKKCFFCHGMKFFCPGKKKRLVTQPAVLFFSGFCYFTLGP